MTVSFDARIDRGAPADLVAPALARSRQFPRRHDLVDEAEPRASAASTRRPVEDHAHSLLEADLSRKTVHSASQRDGTDERFGRREARVSGRDDEIARERDLETAAKRHAVDRGD